MDVLMDRRAVTDRRSKRVAFRFPERRMGFDRRALATSRRLRVMDAYRRRPALVAWCVAAVMALGAIDFLLTLRLMGMGATEINPVMARLFESAWLSAAVFKALVTLGVGAAVWILRGYRRVLELSLAVLVVMTAVVIYEITGLLVVSG